MEKNYLSNPHRYTFAPRSLAEAYRGTEYACAIHVYREPGTHASVEFFKSTAVLVAIGLIVYLFVTL